MSRISINYLKTYHSISEKISFYVYIKYKRLTNKLFNFCYFTIYKKKRKYFLCLGLCSKIRKLKSSIYLVNSKDGVIIRYTLSLFSPALVQLNSYNTYSYCISPHNLKNKTKFELVHYDNDPSLYSDYNSLQFDVPKFLHLKRWGLLR